MRKFSVIFLILSLILSTVFIKNSTKKIEDEIFASEENIRVLRKEFEKMKLEFDYLSSAENLLKFQNLYFDDELTKKNILKIKVINNDSFDIE